ARLAGTVSTTLEDGGVCLIVVGLLTMWLQATLDVSTVWRKILPEQDVEGHAVCCGVCERVMPARLLGEDCERCGARVRVRKPQSISRAAALTFASLLFYIPANLLPMATLPVGLKQMSYTVLGGVIDLVEVRLVGLAALVFAASFLIPFLKLIGLSWCIYSAARKVTTHLKFKTKLYHAVELLGRWSMVDPLVLACFVPVTQYNTAIGGRVEPAAPAFTAVVVLTVIAAKAFDPRLMWDAMRSRA
ncbi:MAG: paraquat-inducible protein A, partial [Clostridia bacterium]|nr:paraquat-inducible protein A [Deltaproteobacteria bacterium]